MKKRASRSSREEKTSDMISPCSPIVACRLSRRELLKAGLGAAVCAVASIFPRIPFAGTLELLDTDRILSFYNTHTGETLKAVYCRGGNYLAEAIGTIHHILRDHRTNQVRSIDLPLLDLLYALRVKLQNDQPFHIISGYRSPVTNANLCHKNRQVAPKSFHILGKAIDIRLPECDLPALRSAALALHGGGVGYYPKSGFIHIDVGPVRAW
jgi:uncharacterized protein YcbK (DUF882 family)